MTRCTLHSKIIFSKKQQATLETQPCTNPGWNQSWSVTRLMQSRLILEGQRSPLGPTSQLSDR